MNRVRVDRFVLVLFFAGMLSLMGCANFVQPEIGSIALQDSRIRLTPNGVQDAVWSTDDLELKYSISETDDTFLISGELAFDRSLTDSFNVAEYFSLKMSFLDSEGKVLQTVDITPLVYYLGDLQEKMGIQASTERPTGADSIVFNYYGVFKGSAPEVGGDEWSILYFPFDQ